MKYDVTDYKNTPYARCQWGGDKINDTILCKQCADELWQRIKPSLNLGIMFFTILPLLLN